MSILRLKGYQIMWIFVFFDMPVTKAIQRKRAARFRKNLLKSGFNMMQFSVYTKNCPSLESAQASIKRIESYLEPDGNVSILLVTDKQYGNILNFWGKKEKKLKSETWQQLELF